MTGSYLRDPLMLIVPCAVGTFGLVMAKKWVRNVADEVHDAGDSLIVRFGAEQQRIPLSDIIGVSWSFNAQPARITDDDVADDLTVRVGRARRAA